MGNIDCTTLNDDKCSHKQIIHAEMTKHKIQSIQQPAVAHGDQSTEPDAPIGPKQTNYRKKRESSKTKLDERKKRTEIQMKKFIDDLEQESKHFKVLPSHKIKQNIIPKRASHKLIQNPQSKSYLSFERFLQSQQQFVMKKQQYIIRQVQQKEISQLSKFQPLQPFYERNFSLTPPGEQSLVRSNSKITATRLISQIDTIILKKEQGRPAQNNSLSNLEQLISHLEKLESEQKPSIFSFQPPFPRQSEPAQCLNEVSRLSNGCVEEDSKILQVEIMIDNKPEKIVLRYGDDLEQLAINFLQRHHLPIELTQVLVSTILERLPVN